MLYFFRYLLYIVIGFDFIRNNYLKKNRYKFKKPKVVYAEKTRFLADKEIIFRSGGRAKVFNISHNLQVFFLIFMAAIFCWSGYNYHYYHKSTKIIHRKDKELDKTRDAYAELISDVTALQNNLKDVVASVEEAGNGINELNAYKEKALVVEDKMKHIADSENWLDADKIEDEITKKEALIQKDMVVEENNVLRSKIGDLGEKLDNLQQTVRGLENAEIAILDKIEKLSGKEIDDIKTTLSKINSTLKVQKQYFNPLANIKDGQGGVYEPIEGTKIEQELQDKISSTFKKLDLLDKYKTTMGEVPLGMPIYKYRLTSTFGGRADPIKNTPARHKGIDLSASIGSRVSAPAAGRVVSAGFQNNGYGNLVEIKHFNGFSTKYAHLNKIYVKKGDMVRYNQAIGEVGKTGRATGSHLHYEVLYNGRNVNPLTFVNIRSMNES